MMIVKESRGKKEGRDQRRKGSGKHQWGKKKTILNHNISMIKEQFTFPCPIINITIGVGPGQYSKGFFFCTAETWAFFAIFKGRGDTGVDNSEIVGNVSGVGGPKIPKTSEVLLSFHLFASHVSWR